MTGLKTLDEPDLAISSIPKATFDYLASLKWLRAKENACLIGPAGIGNSHPLLAQAAGGDVAPVKEGSVGTRRVVPV